MAKKKTAKKKTAKKTAQADAVETQVQVIGRTTITRTPGKQVTDVHQKDDTITRTTTTDMGNGMSKSLRETIDVHGNVTHREEL